MRHSRRLQGRTGKDNKQRGYWRPRLELLEGRLPPGGLLLSGLAGLSVWGLGLLPEASDLGGMAESATGTAETTVQGDGRDAEQVSEGVSTPLVQLIPVGDQTQPAAPWNAPGVGAATFLLG